MYRNVLAGQRIPGRPAGELPGSLTVEVPCHSPRAERWFDMLISGRRDDRGRRAGATVTLFLTRAQTRVLLPAGPKAGSGPARYLGSDVIPDGAWRGRLGRLGTSWAPIRASVSAWPAGIGMAIRYP